LRCGPPARRARPDEWSGEYKGHYVEHDKAPIPITVHVHWLDGGEGELDGWTSQWTRADLAGRLRPELPGFAFRFRGP
jgi:hypothetical protein